MVKEETMEVTLKLKVPKRLMDLIEEQNYFDWSKEDFWVSAAKHLVGGELSRMEFGEMEKLYERYGENVDVVYPPRDC